MSNNPLSALTAAELAAAAAPIQATLTNIGNSDGSVAAITGQSVALQGQLIAILPTLQKIGVQNVANFLNSKITEALTSATAAPVVEPKAEPAEAPPAA